MSTKIGKREITIITPLEKIVGQLVFTQTSGKTRRTLDMLNRPYFVETDDYHQDIPGYLPLRKVYSYKLGKTKPWLYSERLSVNLKEILFVYDQMDPGDISDKKMKAEFERTVEKDPRIGAHYLNIKIYAGLVIYHINAYCFNFSRKMEETMISFIALMDPKFDMIPVGIFKRDLEKQFVFPEKFCFINKEMAMFQRGGQYKVYADNLEIQPDSEEIF